MVPTGVAQPVPPNPMVPRVNADTLRPVRPSCRYCMSSSPLCGTKVPRPAFTRATPLVHRIRGYTRPMRLLAAVVLLGSLVTPGAPGAPGAPAVPAAPGAPGTDQQYLPADKAGLITAHSAASKVWATVQREGGLGEIFYPTIGGPAARALRFVVADHHGHAWLASGAATSLVDSR